MKKYIIVAGVNGAGKSSLYNELKNETDLGIRINADEIQVKQNKSLVVASKMAVKLLNESLLGDKTFHQETTFAGRKVLKSIQQAKDNGFYVKIIYVGLESKELAIKRVANRVKNGGHDVPKDLIESRYDSSLENLKIAMNLVDEIEVYDNSIENELIYLFKNGIELFKSPTLPMWIKPIIDEKSLEIDKVSLKEKLKKAKEKVSPIKYHKDISVNDIESDKR